MKLAHLKNKIRLFAATLLYVASRMVPALAMPSHRGKTRVLVFHHVDDPSHFRKIIACLTANYHVISYSQYLRGQKSTDRINVIIALDDGYQSWYQSAFPVFIEFGVLPLIFVNSDFVGLTVDSAHRYCQTNITTWPESAINWTQLKEMISFGAEIGGHTAGHLNLRTAPTDGVVYTAIREDKLLIEQRVGKSPNLFAYPFGLHDSRAANAVRRAGYSYAFTSDSGFLDDSPDNYRLYRSNIGMRPPLVVRAMVEGWPDRLSHIVRSFKGYRALKTK